MSSSASAVLRCRTKTGVDSEGVSAQRSMNRTARSPDGFAKHQLKEHLQRHLPNDSVATLRPAAVGRAC